MNTVSTIDARAPVGVVVIGRNEGDRLVACLKSIANRGGTVVYVDSGSTDGSAERAETLGATVVHLAMDKPFTAARARNAGFRKLLEIVPEVAFVQFVDGDCVVADGWIAFARDFLANHPDVAIVCGRRQELHPEASIYNRICDFEWDTPVGTAEACGGDFSARADAFDSVGGFDEHLIAGEEPELCYRLRRKGWQIYRADHAMTFHDASMTRFSQWIKRATRAGYAYAARAALHRGTGDRYCFKENVRIVFWAALLPLGAVALGLTVSPWAFALLLAYQVQLARLLWQFDPSRRTPGWKRYCVFLLMSKWPEFAGQLLFAARWIRGGDQKIIEYK